ncbi:HNH endonuclease [Thalassotalea mangrovi]|uniref:Putative HNH nuclease YajD n=2 Tax=Thalassotalea mangrovi TaxID=2572245 RepID=A0A4U1B5N6_9GAMM|nr:HNH endonuclease [Thalassotalea mangrovi]
MLISKLDPNPKTKRYKTLKGAYRSIHKFLSEREAERTAFAILSGPEIGREEFHHSGEVPIEIKQSQENFYLSPAWLELRRQVLERDGFCCQLCGASPKEDKVKLEVDHIKERALYPELALTLSNLQTLCKPCHSAKTNHFNRKS